MLLERCNLAVVADQTLFCGTDSGSVCSVKAFELLNIGEEVIIVDNLSNSKLCVLDRIETITGKRPTFIKCDLLDT